MKPYSEVQQAMLDDEENRLTKKRKQANYKSATKVKLDAKISGYQKTLPTAIDSFYDTSHNFLVLSHAMNLKVDFLGPLYYAVTKNTVLNAFGNPALAETVATLIGNDKVPGIEVTSASAYSITTRLFHIFACF